MLPSSKTESVQELLKMELGQGVPAVVEMVTELHFRESNFL